MKRNWLVTTATAALIAAMIWLISPHVSGQSEPWDSYAYYLPALALGGALSGFISPKPIWSHYLGSLVGQLLYELLVMKAGGLFLAGAVLLLGFCAVFAAAAWMSGKLRQSSSTVR